MKKILVFFGAFFLSTFLSSCFQIKEKISINRDGSGSYAMEMDFSESKTLFQMLLQMAQTDEGAQAGLDGNPLEGLDDAFDELSAQLNQLKGIRKAAGIKDVENFRFGLTLQFDDVEALNLALAQMDANGESVTYTPYYAYTRGKLEKNNVFNLNNLIDEINPQEKGQVDGQIQEQLQQLYESVTYALVIETDGKIRKYDNPDAVLSADKTALTYTKQLIELPKSNIANIIRFK